MSHVIADKWAYFASRTIAKQIVNNMTINYIKISINKKINMKIVKIFEIHSVNKQT